MKKEKLTPVVFRVWNARPRDVIALFPALAAGNLRYLCESYEHFGQHGPADYINCIRKSKLAARKESASLLAELRRIGYKLRIVKRATRAMVARRSRPEGLVV